MRPFEKDSQSVVSKGRRKTKTKLAAPKSKSAAALIKRKNRNAKRRQQHETIDNLCKEPCQFVPVRRKPLGEYMNLEVSMPMTMQMQVPTSMSTTMPMASPSPSMQGMRMSYAAAVQTGAGVKVMISPRLNKANTSSKSVQQHSKAGKSNNNNNRITADTKFRIFDEQPKKPHIVRVDPKLFRADAEQKSRMKSSSKAKKPINKSPLKATSASTAPNDVDIKALKLQFKRLACNAAGATTVAFKGNSLSACDGQAARRNANSNANDSHKAPTFADSVSYFSFHQQRLQRIIDKQGVCAICLQSPEAMMIPQFEDKHFKYLEEAALLAQNRTMLRLWMNSDLLIS
ncbi:hypothetical protein KR093_002764 [Drosophila rubida]|uniref:Uncharacterized protein n=1 Tax=Drosophila rubida TaxID=30044 RepID=A0AAD4PK99_9MUSC|nr:hypothetical protein KR093_002764 [Drosophila rubida]